MTATPARTNGRHTTSQPQTRIAPHAVEAEEAVLGSILINPEVILDVDGLVTGEDFFIVRHRWIWDAIQSIHARREAIDYLTVVEELGARGQLDEAGGPAYITHLINSTPTSIHAESYARFVERAATRRRLLDAAGEIAQAAHDEETEIAGVIDRAEGALFAATNRRGTHSDQSLSGALGAYYDELEHLYTTQDKPVGVPTGFRDLDALLCGLQKGDLAIVASRPGMGKTSWLLCTALNAARAGARVGIFSLEMKTAQIVHRLLAIETGINAQNLRLGKLCPEEWELFVQATDVLSRLPVWIDDAQGVTPAQLRTQARRWWARDGLDLVIVDYIQRMRAGSKADDFNRVQALAEISNGLKNLAGELNIPVLVAAQLKREVDLRRDKHPELSDLRGSGDLEQDADVVLFIFRDDYYDPDSERPGIAEIDVAKHRNGPTGRVELFFRRELTKFTDVYKRHVNLEMF
jgi:replicative DNA helicase